MQRVDPLWFATVRSFSFSLTASRPLFAFPSGYPERGAEETGRAHLEPVCQEFPALMLSKSAKEKHSFSQHNSGTHHVKDSLSLSSFVTRSKGLVLKIKIIIIIITPYFLKNQP